MLNQFIIIPCLIGKISLDSILIIIIKIFEKQPDSMLHDIFQTYQNLTFMYEKQFSKCIC